MQNHILRAIQKTTTTTTDPYFNQVALLLHGDGTNGAQNNTFVDSSTNNFSITRNGNATQGTFSPFSLPDGQWSNFFDGNGDFFTIPSNTAFDQNAGDWTIESWVYLTAGVNATFGTVIFGQEFTRQVKLAISNTGVVVLDQAGVGVRVTGTTVLQVGQWYHLAAVRNGSTLSLYVNGVSEGTPNTTTTFAASGNTIHIARRPDIAYFLTGYISNLRFVKGTALYTSAFTPSTTPLTAITNTSLLTCQSNRFVDNSSNNFAITRNGDVRVTAFSPFAPTSAYSPSVNGGSGYLDGSGDYLSVANNAALQMGSSSFTMEGWVYLTSASALRRIFTKGVDTSSNFEFYFGINASNQLQFGYSSTGNSTTILATTSLTANTWLNQWHHVAAVYDGSAITLYLDGVSVATVSYSSGLFSSTAPINIGASSTGSTGNWLGYLSNLRILKGTALYTANFTPPTAPLTAITNTSLLLNFTNAGIFDNAAKNVIETVGNAQVSTSVTKFGTGSMYFDGSGDWIVSQNPNAVPVGRATFTIEGWINFGSSANKKCIAAWGTASTNQLVSFVVNAAGNGLDLGFWFNDLSTGNIGLAQNTWYHVVAQYDGTTRRIFVDGVQVATNTTTSLNVPVGTQIIRVGANGTGAPEAFIGYIDDLRITNGIARYTSAGFTPPSAPYPDL